MSTVFCKKFVSYLIHSKHFSFTKDLHKTLDKLLTGPRVSKAGRPDLYCRGPHSEVIKHVFYRLDAAEPKDWCLDGLLRFPNKLQSDGFDSRSRQTPRLVPQPGLARPVVDRHGRVGVCDGQGVGPRFFHCSGDKSNVCNKGGKLDPEGSLGRGLPGGPNHLCCQGGVAPELHSAPLHVRTGDVQLIPRQPLGVFEGADHLYIVFEGVAEDVGDDGRIEFSQYREFFGDERPNPHVLESDGIEHPRGGLAQPGSGGTFDGFTGKALGDEASEPIQVNKMGEFEAVAERSAGPENRIPQAQRANFYAEVNGASGAHFVEKNSTKLFVPAPKS